MTILQKITNKIVLIFFEILGFICGLFRNEFISQLISALNRRAKIIIEANEKNIIFYVPNPLSLWRAKTLLTKEPDTIEWIDSFDKNDIFWDIGANIGCYTLYAGVVCNIKTFAFEPSPSNYFLLAKNVELNNAGDLISAFGIALSDKTQIATLNMATTEVAGAHSSFGENRNQYGEKFIAVYKHTMLGYGIDDFIEKYNLNIPSHIKIDVDGIEDLIIEGAKKTLKSSKLKSVLIELNVNPTVYDQKVIDFLGQAGLKRAEEHEGKTENGIANFIFKRNY